MNDLLTDCDETSRNRSDDDEQAPLLIGNQVPILAWIMQNYGAIMPQELTDNHRKLDASYNPTNKPFQVLTSRVQQTREFAADGGLPISDAEAINALLTVLEASGIVERAVETWKQTPVAYRTTWQQFKDLTTFKLHVNDTLSTPGATNVMWDISNLYLNTPLDWPEYMKIHIDLFPQEIIDHYALHAKKDEQGFLYMEINKGMYGLPQSGILANQLLQRWLAPEWGLQGAE
jgi:hypothetical protein